MPKNRIIQPGESRKFNCGDVVAREDDERHEGVVVAVLGNDARVLWPSFGEKGAKEDIDQDELVLIKRRKHNSVGADPSLRPQTMAESPRAQLERGWLNGRRAWR